jgi:hypothetical protein
MHPISGEAVAGAVVVLAVPGLGGPLGAPSGAGAAMAATTASGAGAAAAQPAPPQQRIRVVPGLPDWKANALLRLGREQLTRAVCAVRWVGQSLGATTAVPLLAGLLAGTSASQQPSAIIGELPPPLTQLLAVPPASATAAAAGGEDVEAAPPAIAAAAGGVDVEAAPRPAAAPACSASVIALTQGSHLPAPHLAAVLDVAWLQGAIHRALETANPEVEGGFKVQSAPRPSVSISKEAGDEAAAAVVGRQELERQQLLEGLDSRAGQAYSWSVLSHSVMGVEVTPHDSAAAAAPIKRTLYFAGITARAGQA